MKPTLTLCVGLPQSGKSTWARAQGSPVVSPDAIRLAVHGHAFIASAEPLVWAIAHAMVAALFGAGHSHVILDACNVTKLRRSEWENDRWELVYQDFPTPPEECRRRAIEAGRPDLLPVIDRMASRWEDPGASPPIG